MRPGRCDFRFPCGGVPFLAVRLQGRDARTGEVRLLPVPGHTIEWTIVWPSDGSETRTQFTAQPLTIDRRTGFVIFPISAARAEEIESASEPIQTRIRVLMPDGTPIPYAVGTIAQED